MALTDEAPKTVHSEFKLSRTLHGHKKAISSVRFSPDGLWLASSSNDTTARIWDARTGAFKATLIGHSLGISDVAWSPDSSILCTASDDLTVCLWSQRTGIRLRTMSGHTNYVMCANFNPQGNLVATGSFDQSVRVWDIERGECLYRLSAHKDVVVSAHFSGDGSQLVTAGFDGAVRIWDVNSGQLVRVFEVHDEKTQSEIPVCFAKWSPNSKFILMGSFDDTWKLLNSTTGDVVRTYTGHKFNDYCLFASFSLTEGKFIISGSADSSVCVWDLNSKRLLQQLTGHSDVVVAVAAHPTENIIASGSLDKTIKLWAPQIPPPDPDDHNQLSQENEQENELDTDEEEAETSEEGDGL
jgi:COMPASS component SWD3